MAKENMFAKASSKRVQEQSKIKDNLQNANGADAVRSEPRTTMTLSMSVEDKIVLKMLAIKSEKTVSGMLHDWIEEKSVDEKGEYNG